MNDTENKRNTSKDLEDKEYLDQLANEASDIFNVDDKELAIDDTGDEEPIDSLFNLNSPNGDNNIKRQNMKPRFRLNKPLLLLGVAMIITSAVVISKDKMATNKNRDEAFSSSIVETVTESVKVTEIPVDMNEEIEIYTENSDSNGKMRLTNIPVVVTDEVDAYFKDTIDYLKLAMTVDSFIASNSLYGNTDLVQAFGKLVEDYNSALLEWEVHSVPEGCEKYDSMISKSLSAYQYYFGEVLSGCSLETEEEYRNKLQAAVAYVKATVDYTSTAKDFEPVFYYYGLYE